MEVEGGVRAGGSGSMEVEGEGVEEGDDKETERSVSWLMNLFSRGLITFLGMTVWKAAYHIRTLKD